MARLILRLLLASALLAGTTVATVGPVVAAAPTHNTIVVTCSNGFTRTVAAQAARGVATSLNKFNAFAKSGVTCSAAPGAPRTPPTRAFLTVTCSNGFERRVSSHAAGGIARALTAFNAHNHRHITCAVS
jgi:hypothetical protein